MTFGSELQVSIGVWSVFVSSVSTVVVVCLSVTVFDWEEKQGERQG